jgi:hypothetical protein
MSTTVQFGNFDACRIARDGCTRLAADRDAYPPLGDPVAAVREALAHPQGYPPLASATVPGDRIALALDDDVPEWATMLRGAIVALMEAGVEPADITVVTPFEIADRRQIDHELSSVGATGVSFKVHDPDDEREIAMVGVTAAGTPLRLNRTLAEADLVLPIGVSAPPTDEDAASVKFAGLYPRFSNRETQQRFDAARDETPKQRARRAAEINEAGWLLGIGLSMCVVPGAGGKAAAVLAGEPGVVTAAAGERRRAIWEREAETPGDLVIAALLGDEREQTWHNLGVALQAAERVRDADGAIALLTELAEPPPSPFNRLREAVDFGDVQRELARDVGDQCDAAMALAQALERGPVYLRSRLSPELVESIGMTAIETDDELSRLAGNRDHCVIIEEAQRVTPRLVARHIET